MKLVKLNTVQFCSNTLLKQLSWSSQLLHQLLKGNIGLPKMFEHKNFLIYIFFFIENPWTLRKWTESWKLVTLLWN
jgi:hypothetical protein